MMKESLTTYYNKHNRDDTLLNEEHQKRYNNSVKLPFEIEVKNKKFDSYYNMDAQLTQLLMDIKEQVSIFGELIKHDAPLTNYLLDEVVKNEIMNTNLIEGVHSSRQDIDLVLQELIPKGKRIDEYKLVQAYLKIARAEDYEINDIKQLSYLYKELFEDLLSDKDKIKPEMLFRNDKVGIYKGNKLIHSGIDSGRLEEVMEKLIDYMNNDISSHIIIKVAVFHFFFGYYHPFFDANGRTNRFVTSYYLSKDIGLCGVLISNSLVENKDTYYKLFEETEDMFNRGDMNYFIYGFIDNIHESIKIFNENLRSNMKFFSKIYKKLNDKYPQKNQSVKKEILFYIVRGYVFSDENTFTSKELTKVFEKSKSTIKTKIDELCELEYIVQVNKVGNEYIYKLNENNKDIEELLRDE